MGYLATGEIFENILQLKHFSLYFGGIMNRKWLPSYRNNDISCRDAKGFWGMLPEKILKCKIWYVLMYYFDQIKY